MARKGESISAMVLIFGALCLLMLPFRWIAALGLAMAVHEGSHYMAVRLCGGQVRRVAVTAHGIQMEVSGLTRVGEFLSALAGPAGGLALLLLARFLPRTAICGAFQTMFNLLPVYPLDGGRALRCCMELFLPWTVAHRVCKVVEIISLFGIVAMGIYGTFVLRLGLVPLGAALLLFERAFVGKIPCKPPRFSVQ